MKYTNVTNRTLTFTLNDGKGKDNDVIIAPGESAELPEDNAHVKSLAALNILEQTKETKPANKKD